MRIIVVFLSLAGCSFIGVTSARPDTPTTPCTEAVNLPMTDAVVAVGLTALGIAALQSPNPIAQGDGQILIATAAGLTMSSVYGFSETSRCRSTHHT